MIIETKYNTGDKVWFIANGYIDKAEITDISIKISYKNDSSIRPGRSKLSIQYHLNGYDKCESQLFPTKEELLNSL